MRPSRLRKPDTKRFDVSVQIRNFEIELFWKRSLFFWGFIASAFVGYASLRNSSGGLALVVACFGMVCSCAWTLLNRGSKYWQESWETKVERFESAAVGELFGSEEPVQSYKGPWLSARQFSVSKLAIALSDYVFLLWVTLVAGELARKYMPAYIQAIERCGPAAFVAFSLVYVVLLFWYGGKSARA